MSEANAGSAATTGTNAVAGRGGAWRVGPHTFDPAIRHQAEGLTYFVAGGSFDRTGGVVANVSCWRGGPDDGELLHQDTVALGKLDARRRFARLVAARAEGLQADGVEQALAQIEPPVAEQLRFRRQSHLITVAEGAPYFVEGNALYYRKPIPGTGESAPVKLTNFDARIAAVVSVDDGESESIEVEIEAVHEEGFALPTVRVPMAEYTAMAWVADKLGPDAVIAPGAGTRDRVRYAIQLQAQRVEGRPVRRRVYRHSGWRRIDGRWCYLSCSGATTADGFDPSTTVDLEGNLARIALPAPPEGDALAAAVRASLALWELAPPSVMAPLLGTLYLAPLQEPLAAAGYAPAFVTWLFGGSGALKSSTAAVLMAHFGPFDQDHQPTNFEATPNAVEKLLFVAKDCLVVVDDYNPPEDERQRAAMAAVAARVIRSVGNRQSRQRMTADTRLRSGYPPRCVAMATGERLPEGHSNNARILAVPVAGDAVDPARLAEAQARTQLYAEAMAGYLRWLAGRLDELRTGLAARFVELRAAASAAGAHLRQPAQLAFVHLSLETWLGFAVEVGALDRGAAEAILEAAWVEVVELIGSQGEELAEEKPAARCLNLLAAGFASRRAYVEGVGGGWPSDAERWGWELVETIQMADGSATCRYRPAAGAELIGRVDDAFVYLYPEPLQGYLREAARRSGVPFPVDRRTLQAALDEAGALEVVVERRADGRLVRRRTVNERIGGRVMRVLKLFKNAGSWEGPLSGGNSGNSGNTGPPSSSKQPEEGVPTTSREEPPSGNSGNTGAPSGAGSVPTPAAVATELSAGGPSLISCSHIPTVPTHMWRDTHEREIHEGSENGVAGPEGGADGGSGTPGDGAA
jgi:hypothetical protein